MESSPASAEVKGSKGRQRETAEEPKREREEKMKQTKNKWRGTGGHQKREHAEQLKKIIK